MTPEADLYLQLASRHVDMAQLLLDNNFLDGAIFHAYHAFECATSAGVSLATGTIPWNHALKLRDFGSSFPDDGTRPFQPEWTLLVSSVFSIYPIRRDDALYPRARGLITLNDPRINYSEPDTRSLLNRVRVVVQQIDTYLRTNYP